MLSEFCLLFHVYSGHILTFTFVCVCALVLGFLEQGHKEPQAQHAHPPPQEKIFKDDELIALIDPIMNMDDADGDGFIDYPEFVRAQNKAAAANAGTPRA